MIKLFKDRYRYNNQITVVEKEVNRYEDTNEEYVSYQCIGSDYSYDEGGIREHLEILEEITLN